MKAKPNRKTVRDAIRASVPEGKLRKAKIVVSDQPFGATGNLGGYTQYENKHGGEVVKLAAPIQDDARGVTIRGHETRHASRHKPKRKKPMTENEAIASQIVDDVNDEMGFIPNVAMARPYRRDHLATAMRDVRMIVNRARKVRGKLSPDSVTHRNGQLLLSVRAVAMLLNYGGGSVGMTEMASKSRGLKAVRNAIGHRTLRAVMEVVRMAEYSRKRARAISLLTSLMEKEERPEDMDLPEREKDKGDILAPVDEGTAADSRMKITDLRPKSVFTAKDRQITKRYTPDGVHLNPARYVAAIVSGISHGLFSRRIRQKPGGTLLIDASGSMRANRHNLSAICALNPKATVAYYSGTGAGRGELVIYAYEGKRYAGELPANTIHGGNAVDRPAIQWMMRLPKPWTLVSDLEFCGGQLGDEALAHALVERAVQRGDLTVHRSLDAAYEAFGGKGDLRNAK